MQWSALWLTGLVVMATACGLRAQPDYATPYVFTTLAGTAGASGFVDAMGSLARFNRPGCLAISTTGDLYVAELASNRVRKITPAGFVTSFDSGSSDLTGSAAAYSGLSGVAVDGADNVYVADNNQTIRKITPEGVITIVAGLHGSTGSADGTGSMARFNFPTDLAADSAGNLYVADWGNGVVRKVTTAGVVTTLAGMAGSFGDTDGTGNAARFFRPVGIALDPAGNVYVADNGNHTIRKISPTGVVTTLAGLTGSAGITDGTGSTARFSGPNDIATDDAGNVYVTDNYTIRKITPDGTVTTLAGLANSAPGSADGAGWTARFYSPQGLVADSEGNIYVADYYNDTIRKGHPTSELIIPLIANDSTSTATYGSALTNYAIIGFGPPSSYDATGLPPGLTVNTATGAISGIPTQVGVFSVTLSATNTLGTTTAPLTFTVAKALASVSLGNLTQTYDGTPKSASATTLPDNLQVDVTYSSIASPLFSIGGEGGSLVGSGLDGDPPSDNTTPPTNAGSYLVVATVNDANYTGSASGTLAIQLDFAGYRSLNFSSPDLANPDISGATADPDHDGLSNLLEFALDLNPNTPDSNLTYPAIAMDNGALSLTYLPRANATGLVYTAEVSSDLVTWNSGPDYTLEKHLPPLLNSNIVKVTDLTPISATSKRFIRLKISQP